MKHQLLLAAAILPLISGQPITPQNVKRLQPAWTFRTGESTGPAERGGRNTAFEATPVYFEGLLYLGTPRGKAIALDPLTGAERWSFDAKINLQAGYGDFANRGVTLWQDTRARAGAACKTRVFFAAIDGQLYSLDAKTGKVCVGFGNEGRLELSKGLRRGPMYPGEYENTSPPVVLDDVLVVGSAIADNVRTDAPTGEVRAFDVRSGKLLWTFDPLPSNPDSGGANAWSRLTIDPARHLVFVPTGSASPDYFGGLRPGDNRYANSVVALRIKTGQAAWSFQTVHHDLWDYDVASQPVLVDVHGVAAVAVGSKTGHLFLLNRDTGVPLFPVEERAVPKSTVPGELASATQPFPTLPPALAPQKLPADQAWGPTDADRESCRAQIAALRSEGIFTPPSLEGTVVFPGNIGGMHWGGGAYSPSTHLLVVPTNRMAAVVRLIPRDQVDEYRRSHPDWETSNQRGAPFGMARKFLRSPSGLPCNPPPFGALTAVDVNTGKILWEKPLGKLPIGNVPVEWGSINLGGPYMNDAGVVFIGASLDPAIRAFDAKTGDELWQAALPASARSTPMSFQGPDGKHYVVIAAGGHDTEFGKLDNALVAFVLK